MVIMIDWSQSIINPLNQQLRIHHHMIITHREELNVLRHSESNIVGKLKAVNTLLGDIEQERQKALELYRELYLEIPQYIFKTRIEELEKKSK